MTSHPQDKYQRLVNLKKKQNAKAKVRQDGRVNRKLLRNQITEREYEDAIRRQEAASDLVD